VLKAIVAIPYLTVAVEGSLPPRGGRTFAEFIAGDRFDTKGALGVRLDYMFA
jgi:hypothetical protein